MKTIVFAIALCAVMSMSLTPAVQAADASLRAVPVIVAKDKGAVERCVKWIKKVITEKVNGKTVTRTVAVCAVRG